MKKIILIVGASGVGKDSLLKSLKGKININFVKRYITREPDQNENNYYIDDEAFHRLKKDDFFISTWEAHTNKYAIAKNQIVDGLNLISISRGAIKDFEGKFEYVTTINITIPKEQLFQRLKNRARESDEEIQKRIDRSYTLIDAKNLIEFDNSKSIEESTQDFINLIQQIANEK
ncbi:AAA family ATPase [Halarcobacter anaerophilus]|uniref:AAA family ATPase n=1 Tax=Halarcobacter anaerophilus TaxID=877500 RepID=UPI0005C8A5AE|nr:AAA family ATPase [Halarcobacter anaerophilus]